MLNQTSLKNKDIYHLIYQEKKLRQPPVRAPQPRQKPNFSLCVLSEQFSETEGHLVNTVAVAGEEERTSLDVSFSRTKKLL